MSQEVHNLSIQAIRDRISGFASLGQGFQENARDFSDLPLFSQAVVDLTREKAGKSSDLREWVTTTFGQGQRMVTAITVYLRDVLGVQKGDPVGIVSNQRPEFSLAELAIYTVGGVVVPPYADMKFDDTGYVLNDASHSTGADRDAWRTMSVVFAENKAQVEKIVQLITRGFEPPGGGDRIKLTPKSIVVFEDVPPEVSRGADGALQYQVIPLRDILKGAQWQGVLESATDVARKDLASIVYTSGTSGAPKGVLQTHGNHLENIDQIAASGIYEFGNSIGMVLPQAHAFGQRMAHLGSLALARLVYPGIFNHESSELDKYAKASIFRDMREGHPTILPIVPKALARIRDKILHGAGSYSLRGLLIAMAVKAAKKRYEVEQINLKREAAGLDGPKLAVGSFWRKAYDLTAGIRRAIKERTVGKDFGPEDGGGFQFFVSGGASLPADLSDFFNSLGMPICQGYGTSETCVAVAAETPGVRMKGSVGKPFPGCVIELEPVDDDDRKSNGLQGEIVVSGPNVVAGYHNRPEDTEKSFVGGRYHTGDHGRFINGFLQVDGRLRDRIVLTSGEKVSPDRLENGLKGCLAPLVSDALVVGHGREYCIALFAISAEGIESWAKSEGIKLSGQIWRNKKFVRFMDEEVKKFNDTNHYVPEHIKTWGLISSENLTVESGLMTSTLKLKRAAVERYFADLVEQMYQKRGRHLAKMGDKIEII